MLTLIELTQEATAALGVGFLATASSAVGFRRLVKKDLGLPRMVLHQVLAVALFSQLPCPANAESTSETSSDPLASCLGPSLLLNYSAFADF